MCIVLPEIVPPEYVNEKRLLSVTAFFFVRSIDGFDQSVDHDVEIALGTVPFETDQAMYRTGECFVTMDQHLFDQRLFVQGYFFTTAGLENKSSHDAVRGSTFDG